MVVCPECKAELEDYDEDELDVGDEFTCDECGENVRVVSLGPLELESAEEDDDEDEEDEDDEDDDDDEDDEEDDEDEEFDEDGEGDDDRY